MKPVPLLPNTPAECTSLCRDALAHGQRLQILGAKTRAVLGEAQILSTANLNAIRFFHPQDMVIGVEAGLAFADLWPVLEEKNMAMPVNAWFERATFGGMVAANDFGADRMFGGGLRDHLIGIEYVNGRGELVEAGGQVVKNVTGYDAARMMIGSLGGFGCITALNFRLVPAKTDPMVAFLGFESLDPLADLQQLVEARSPLDWVEVRGAAGDWQFAFGYSGNPARRDALETRLKQRLGSAWQYAGENDLPQDWHWAKTQARCAGFLDSLPIALGPHPWHLHLNAPTSFWSQLRFIREAVANGGYWVLHPFGGDGHWFLPSGEVFQAGWPPWRQFFGPDVPVGSCLELIRVPEQIAKGSHRFVPLPAEYPLACELKRHLDPNALFYSPFYQMQESGSHDGEG